MKVYYIVEYMDCFKEFGQELLKTFSREEAIDFARVKQKHINWFDCNSKEFKSYITIDKYQDDVLVEVIEF